MTQHRDDIARTLSPATAVTLSPRHDVVGTAPAGTASTDTASQGTASKGTASTDTASQATVVKGAVASTLCCRRVVRPLWR